MLAAILLASTITAPNAFAGESSESTLKEGDPGYYALQTIQGSEEAGLVGSNYYVSQLSSEEIDNAVAMINLDSLSVVDHMLIYGNSGTDGFVRDLGLDIAERLNLNITTQVGLNPMYPAGTTIDASDHVAFKYAGIPYGYLEATNWELGEMDGYTQTEKTARSGIRQKTQSITLTPTTPDASKSILAPSHVSLHSCFSK